MTMEPDWSNVDAARSWLDSRYPNSNNQTGSPLYQYLNDELAKGHNLEGLKGRETHLSTGKGGEFIKFLFENSGDNAVCYGTMRVTYYPVKHYPEFRVPSPPTSDDDSPEPERTEKRVGSEEARTRTREVRTISSNFCATPTKKTANNGQRVRANERTRNESARCAKDETAKFTRQGSSCAILGEKGWE